MKHVCPHCGKGCEVKTGYFNRAKKLGMPIYCSRVCSGLARRVERTEEEMKAIKKAYDKARLNGPLREKILKEKSDYAKTPKGRELQRRQREKKKDYQAAYIKSKRYRQWKKAYDEKYVAKKNYGEFWEAAIVLKTIDEIILPEKQEAKIQKGTYNKSQKRKRQWNSQQRI